MLEASKNRIIDASSMTGVTVPSKSKNGIRYEQKNKPPGVGRLVWPK